MCALRSRSFTLGASGIYSASFPHRPLFVTLPSIEYRMYCNFVALRIRHEGLGYRSYRHIGKTDRSRGVSVNQ